MNQLTTYTQPETLPAFLAEPVPTGIESVQRVADQLAELGRYEDNYIVHASEGETVIPLAVLDRNPGLKDSLFEQMRQMGLEPERYVVGNELNSINPVTGQPEFFLKRIGRGVKKAFKRIAPVFLPALLSSTPLGPIYGAMAGSFGAKLVQGGTLKQGLRSALISGGVAGLARGLQGMGTDAGFFGTIRQDLQSPGARFAGAFTGKGVGVDEYWTNPFNRRGASKTYEETTRGTPDFRQDIYNPQPPANVVPPTVTNEVAVIKSSLPGGGKNLSISEELEVYKIAQDKVAAAEVAAKVATDVAKPGLLSNYGPQLAVGALGIGALGGFDEGEDEDVYDFYRDDPRYAEGTVLGDLNQRLLTSPGLGQPRPFVPTPIEDVVVPSRFAADGGEIDGQYFPPRIGSIRGPGTGTSDDVPAMLSDGEFVMTADAVRGAGNGSREQGMRNMYNMMRRFEGGPVGMADGGEIEEDPQMIYGESNYLPREIEEDPQMIFGASMFSPDIQNKMQMPPSTRSDQSWALSDLMDSEKRGARRREHFGEEEIIENFILDEIAAGELPPGATIESLDPEQQRELAEALDSNRWLKAPDYPYRMMPDSVIQTLGDIPKPVADAAIGAMDLYRDFQEGTIGRPDLRKNLEGFERRQP